MLDRRLLTRYVTDACSPEERRAVERWAEGDPSHRATLRRLEQIWETAGPISTWDVDAAWQQFMRENMTRDRRPERPFARRSARPARRPAPSTHRRMRSRTSWAASLAVVLLLVAAVSYLWPLQLPSQSDQVASERIVTQPGERARVTLGDGTKVHLGVASTLQYPARFASDRRSVTLDGEAYFEVAHDTSRPFVISANGTTTRVLGTAFSVSAYSADSTVRVAVREGRVAFRPRTNASERVIARGQVGRADVTGRIDIATPGNLHAEMGWLEGELVFEDEPFAAVLRRLERWYAIDARLADSTLAERRLTATFANEALPEALDVIDLALHVRHVFDEQRRTVTFSPR